MLTVERLKELLHYEPDTGVFTRRVSRGAARVGRVAGYPQEGYTGIMIDGRRYQAHRLAWLYMLGSLPSKFIDHINGDWADNRLANLREATVSQNGMNAKRPSDNTSGFKGVSLYKRTGRWVASIKFNGQQLHLGYYDTPEEAFAARQAAAKKYHGEFARAA